MEDEILAEHESFVAMDEPDLARTATLTDYLLDSRISEACSIAWSEHDPTLQHVSAGVAFSWIPRDRTVHPNKSLLSSCKQYSPISTRDFEPALSSLLLDVPGCTRIFRVQKNEVYEPYDSGREPSIVQKLESENFLESRGKAQDNRELSHTDEVTVTCVFGDSASGIKYRDTRKLSPQLPVITSRITGDQNVAPASTTRSVSTIAHGPSILKKQFVLDQGQQETKRGDVINFRPYPPLSNKDFYLTSEGHTPLTILHRSYADPDDRGVTIRGLDKIKYIAPEIWTGAPTNVSDNEAVKTPDIGVWKRDCAANDADLQAASSAKWVGLRHRGPLTNAYLKCVLLNDQNSDLQPMFCRICNEKHILSGPRDTLPDRDTCGAFLPEWFPVEKYTNPWSQFRDIYGRIIFEETNYLPICSGDYSDRCLKYHDFHPKWQAIGRGLGFGKGFWRCESGPRAPVAERECELCNPGHPVYDIVKDYFSDYPKQRRYARCIALVEWVHDRCCQIGLRDRAVAEGIAALFFSLVERLEYSPLYRPLQSSVNRHFQQTHGRDARRRLHPWEQSSPAINANNSPSQSSPKAYSLEIHEATLEDFCDVDPEVVVNLAPDQIDVQTPQEVDEILAALWNKRSR